MISYIVFYLNCLVLAGIGVATKKKKWYFILGIIMILFSGLRYETGGDFESYEKIFLDDTFAKNSNIDLGYRFLNIIIKNIGGDIQSIFLIVSILTVTVFLLAYKEYSPFKYLSIILFLRSYYVGFNFALMRQGLAVALFVFSWKYF